ncbi:MAG: hypothetical protein LUD12_12030 [Lachnospiraceae bacterium]|nr:hypothetical protein [Lachnospiraceae bacterium]
MDMKTFLKTFQIALKRREGQKLFIIEIVTIQNSRPQTACCSELLL